MIHLVLLCRDRVVAAFITGAAWQFRDWKWKAANEALSNMAGFYVKFDAEPVPPVIGSWNATVLKVCSVFPPFLLFISAHGHFWGIGVFSNKTDEPHAKVS